MYDFATKAGRDAIEAEGPWSERDVPPTVHAMLTATAGRHPGRPAATFQLTAGPKDRAETLSWAEMLSEANRAANLFRSLGVGEGDVVAYVLPNALETLHVLHGGMAAGVVCAVNPLLEPAQIAAILRESGAKVVVTLRAFPRTDVAAKVARALEDAPGVEAVLEVDLARYLGAPKAWIAGAMRPKHRVRHRARVLDFAREAARRPDRLSFEAPREDRIAALFHTGGTTGMPKLAQQRHSGIVYNAWLGSSIVFTHQDVLMCPLPLFHIFAVHPVWMAAMMAGSHVVFPTPAGYRGDGVFDRFWQLIERHRASFLITVPTAIAALMQRPVDADVSSLRTAISGSAPLPVELYRRFERATGVAISEGYGLTEATCLVSCNPVDGVKKVGSVGFAFPYTDVRIVRDGDGGPEECPEGETGEICVSSPGVIAGATYTDPERNRDLYRDGRYLRTGDLGRIDEEGYLWITGRAKDVIIRGGHNIDPAVIEEALAGHEAVAFAGAIGQPDAHSGEVPCAYVELVEGADVTPEALIDFARDRIPERAARPKHVEIMPELPKTAVGKVFKPDLRRRAIARVYDAALAEAGAAARVAEVVEDRHRGLVARLERTGEADDEAVERALALHTRPWEWA